MSLSTNVTDLATRVATEAKSLRTLLNNNQLDNSALTTSAKTNLVAAINEVAAAAAASSGIDDGTTSINFTWSSQKITDEIDLATALVAIIDDVNVGSTSVYSSLKTDVQIADAVAALVDTAPGNLNTLEELAAALGDDAAFSTTVTTALGNRVRTDTAAQGLNSTQQGNARTNILAAATADVTALSTAVGSTTTNYVTTFEAGLV